MFRGQRAKSSLFLFVAIFWCLGAVCPAQSNFGSIRGQVRDASGGAVPGVSVRITDVGTNAEVIIKTGNDGQFVASGLRPVIYDIVIEANVTADSVGLTVPGAAPGVPNTSLPSDARNATARAGLRIRGLRRPLALSDRPAVYGYRAAVRLRPVAGIRVEPEQPSGCAWRLRYHSFSADGQESISFPEPRLQARCAPGLSRRLRRHRSV